MQRTIDFYFDFSSPFSYLANSRLPAIARAHQLELVYKIVDVAALKEQAGNQSQPNTTVSAKTKYLEVDKERWAARYGVPIRRPNSSNFLLISIGFFYAADLGQTHEYVRVAWHEVWGEGNDPTDVRLLSEIAATFGWEAEHFLTFVKSERAMKRLLRSTEEALENGVFGVPTMVVGQEMWWGNDRLELLDEHLWNIRSHHPTA